MRECLTIKNIGGWVWTLREPGALDGWFDPALETLAGAERVKSNALREVRRVKTPDGASLYVKHDRPRGFFSRIKSRFRDKCGREFEAALVLEDAGVPVVRYLGHARRRFDTLLVSRALEGAVSARDLWFNSAADDPALRRRYLDGLADFLGRVLRAGIWHPDFHIGNLLARPEDCSFTMVDPYGAGKVSPLGLRRLFKMAGVTGALRGEIEDSEAAALLKKAVPPECGLDPGKMWESILKTEAAGARALWRKRRKHGLGRPGKYFSAFNISGCKFYVRHTVTGALMADPDTALESGGDLEHKSFDGKRAQKIWAASFRLQFHRINHNPPAVWQRGAQRDTLLFPRLEPAEPPAAALELFLGRCAREGVLTEPGNIISSGGKAMVADVEKVKFRKA
jgi:hypothetical protein